MCDKALELRQLYCVVHSIQVSPRTRKTSLIGSEYLREPRHVENCNARVPQDLENKQIQFVLNYLVSGILVLRLSITSRATAVNSV